ncbi:DNA methylase N 6 adenine specific isoform 2 [Schistosoma japonicum]|uniref:DNA methylase N 6 adenine specific isoform 2 n=1 Tax=Schistosoma japonicum TaxID=6182 RepID=A0A4Z2D4A1_SCHJA|nr:DNA methylase N 6 adenine specific isoform 2 [Schistosoma japonicum]
MEDAFSHTVNDSIANHSHKSISDSGISPGEISNFNSSQCGVPLSCATPIMTVTNPAPKTQQDRSFCSLPSHAYTAIPHTHLSVHNSYESSDTQSSPQMISVIKMNGDNLNKLSGGCKTLQNISADCDVGAQTTTSASTLASGIPACDVAAVTNPIDSELTACKIKQLQHDVVQLETAIKNNLNEQKELNDRLFEQLAEVSKPENNTYKSSSSLLSSSSWDQSVSCESEIKRIYSEKVKMLKKQLKALNEQLQTTHYIIEKLEAYGIPLGQCPKDYVKQFINSRLKSSIGCATTPSLSKGKTSLPSTSLTNNQQPLSCSSSATNDNRNQISMPLDVCRSHELAKTLPARISNPSVDPFKPPARQSNTLPAKTIYDSRPSNSDRLFGPSTQFYISGPYINNSDMKPVPSSRSSLATPISHKHETNEPIMSTGIYTPHKPMLTSHPTAPHFYPHLSHNDPIYSDVYHSSKLVATPNTSVLSTVRTGLGSFGRQLFRVGKPRSHSDENIPVKVNGISPDDNACRKKGSSRPVGYSFFTPNDKKKHKKITKSHLAVSNLLYPPESSSIFIPENLASSSSQPIRAGSLSSTNGINLVNYGGYDPGGGRSMISGFSGMIGTTASKDDPYPGIIDPSNINTVSTTGNNNIGSSSWPEGGDNTLARIFEFLGVSANQVFSSHNLLLSGGNNNVAGVGSSGSSALSASGLGVLDKTKAGSKSHISGANIVSPESFSTPHSGGIATGSLSGTGVGCLGGSNSVMSISPNNLALSFAYLYRRQECQFALLTNQQSQIFQELRDELAVMHNETRSIQSTLNNLTTELEAIRRDATTKAELQNQKLTDASSRIERLDAIAEESRQALPHELAAIRNEFHDSLYSVEYQVTTKIRDLSDNITSINNKVSMIEKPHDQSNALGAHGTELDRVRRKVLHYLTDLCVSFFALVTMLLQVLIRCLNLGAVLTENRKLAVCFSMTVLASCLLVYTSDPIILWLRGNETITDNSDTINRRSQHWRNILIAILSFFRSFSRGMS